MVENPYRKILQGKIKKNDTELDYIWSERPDCVMVIPVLFDREKPTYVMVEQDRFPVNVRCLEFPAGKIDKGEEPLAAAKRELMEETGLEGIRFKLLDTVLFDPGYTTAKCFVYLAVTSGQPHAKNLEISEKLSNLVPRELGTESLHRAVLSGEIMDALTLAATSILLLQNPKAKEYLGAQEDINEEV